MTIKTYTELLRFNTFRDRFRYLALRGEVGKSTFGYDRWMNQGFYTSRQWRDMREYVIARDEGLDLGAIGHDIHTQICVHHMNPMTPDDLIHGDPSVLDPEFLITTCHTTHNAIHYGDESLLPRPFVPRRAGDTKLW